MRLLYSPTSPYVRKVEILLRETGLTDRVRRVPASGTPIEPDRAVVSANPLGKIPALERPEGPTLYDSRVICRYLDSLHDRPKLYPEPPALWATLTLEALADGALDAALLTVYEQRLRDETQRSAPWVEGQMAKIVQVVDALEARWIASLAGPLTMGGVAVAAALGYVDFRLPGLDWRSGRPRLAEWHAAFAERPSYSETAPPA